MRAVNTARTFSLGNETEQRITEYLTSKGSVVQKVDHKTYPYDLLVTDKNGNAFAFEVKTFGAPNTTKLFTETVQISKVNKIQTIPEYLEHSEEIDYITWYNRLTGCAYFFDCKVFTAYVLANKHKERLNSYGTGKGILIECECKEAGFLYKREGV